MKAYKLKCIGENNRVAARFQHNLFELCNIKAIPTCTMYCSCGLTIRTEGLVVLIVQLTVPWKGMVISKIFVLEIFIIKNFMLP